MESVFFEKIHNAASDFPYVDYNMQDTNYFAHIFKTATQSTFYNYLTAYRLNKALELLLHSDKKIIDIAQECGFSNTRSFNRSFKSFFSKTTSEYIKENSPIP